MKREEGKAKMVLHGGVLQPPNIWSDHISGRFATAEHLEKISAAL